MKQFLVNISPDRDKLLHFFYGFIFLMFTLKIQSIFGFHIKWVVLAQIALAFAVEIYDAIYEGEVELLDIVYTVLPLLILIFI